jgi:hypothetical protein
MTAAKLQEECELGQELLMATEYLRAEAVLERAESHAWNAGEFDTLARLYMPLQEARRQRRQVCGEGTICLDLVAMNADDAINPRQVIQNFTHGQLLVAGYQTLQPAVELRMLQRKHELYLDTFLAAVYPVGKQRAVLIVPTADVALPMTPVNSMEELSRLSPPNSLVLNETELPRGRRKGNTQTFGEVMALWERLHAPFLAAADAETDPRRKMAKYRETTRVDYACELAHQKLSDVAKSLRASS